MPTEYKNPAGFVISTDPKRLDIAAIHHWLSESSYWAQGRSLDVVTHAIDNSLCFGLYAPDGTQAGFARMVTDYATFAWLCDVFVLEPYRGRGLSKWLVECVVTCPELKTVRRIILATRDAHELYRRYGGFNNMAAPDRWMERISST